MLLVAAQYASPLGFMDGEKRRQPALQSELISEYEIRRHQKIVENSLPDSVRFGEWRERELAVAVDMANSGRIAWNELMELNPALWCLGLPQDVPNQGFVSNMKVPDLVISREQKRAGKASGSIAVEVELTKKSKSEYERTLRTYAIGFRRPFDIGQLWYQTNNPEVVRLITRVDELYGFGLIESGRLKFKSILETDGVTPALFAKPLEERA